jgi:hypothetical protein
MKMVPNVSCVSEKLWQPGPNRFTYFLQYSENTSKVRACLKLTFLLFKLEEILSSHDSISYSFSQI